jgi:cyanophycinase
MKSEKIKGGLIAVGGGESSDVTKDSIEILEKFIEMSGGAAKARIVLMTVATDESRDAVKRYEKIFGDLKLKNLETVNIVERGESFDEEILKKIEWASGLYFTGGDQLHVTTLMGGTPLHELITEKFQKGLTIGGTSAGAMMISSSMIVSGATDVAPRLDSIEVTAGMNLLKDTVIDTHFSQRGRHGRLLSTVAHNPQVLGIGIDERTAMIVRDGEFEVIGEGAVTVICAKNSTHTNLPYIKSDEAIGIFDVGFHVLPKGYKYDLKKREPIAQSQKKIMAATNDE